MYIYGARNFRTSLSVLLNLNRWDCTAATVLERQLLSDIMFWNKKLAFSWTCRWNFSIVELREDVTCSGDSTLFWWFFWIKMKCWDCRTCSGKVQSTLKVYVVGGRNSCLIFSVFFTRSAGVLCCLRCRCLEQLMALLVPMSVIKELCLSRQNFWTCGVNP